MDGVQGCRKECEAIYIVPRHTIGQTELVRVRTPQAPHDEKRPSHAQPAADLGDFES